MKPKKIKLPKIVSTAEAVALFNLDPMFLYSARSKGLRYEVGDDFHIYYSTAAIQRYLKKQKIKETKELDEQR